MTKPSLETCDGSPWCLHVMISVQRDKRSDTKVAKLHEPVAYELSKTLYGADRRRVARVLLKEKLSGGRIKFVSQFPCRK